MKKVLVALMSILALSTSTVHADNDKPIQIGDMPQAARRFITAHFNNAKVSLAMVDADLFAKSYEVIFTDGTKVEFDKNGIWTEVDCKRGTVPGSVLSIAMRNYIAEHYPAESVTKIERSKNEYEVKLSNGMELTFDGKYRLVDIDD